MANSTREQKKKSRAELQNKKIVKVVTWTSDDLDFELKLGPHDIPVRSIATAAQKAQ